MCFYAVSAHPSYRMMCFYAVSAHPFYRMMCFYAVSDHPSYKMQCFSWVSAHPSYRMMCFYAVSAHPFYRMMCFGLVFLAGSRTRENQLWEAGGGKVAKWACFGLVSNDGSGRPPEPGKSPLGGWGRKSGQMGMFWAGFKGRFGQAPGTRKIASGRLGAEKKPNGLVSDWFP